MNFGEILIFIGVAALASGSPGPSVVMVISNALRYDFHTSIAALTGDLAGICLLAALSALGASAVLMANVKLFIFIKIVGAAYLLYIGISTLIKAKKAKHSEIIKPVSNGSVINNKKLWLQSFFVAISNPKAILFFGALFPQFIDTTQALLPQFSILLLLFLGTKAILLSTYAFIAVHTKSLGAGPQMKLALEVIKGFAFIAFGGFLIKSIAVKS